MGLKDLFSSSGRHKSRLDKHIKTVINPYTQSAERYHAMEQLLADGSEEALIGLFRRFTVVSTKSIEDEEEKGWAYRQLSGLGAKVLPAAKAFCLEHDNVAWALRIIEDVADEVQEWEILDALLERHPPGYERDPKKKLQILTHLADIDDPKVAEYLAGYLGDSDEGVRYFAVEQLLDIADEDQSKQALVDRLCHPDEDSLRLRTKVLDGLAELHWDVTTDADRIRPRLGNEHALRDGKVVKR
ncbi:HEAT repeat domain-containing protein [Paraliomyxa miuraensis]|uniref:HEAT repeat domain-containing protein n=1 Tax=Paraliomyxa miuraensis TaxID=376150 RepID=UPI00224F9DF7|nr:HEAT repeat domain-containing protein [Paraliomyxa miuraensis]MCX4242841.1 HEAT repeat domain-containing protein [Paraliomyxa miuraensis]